jgi:hypothetical protein
LAVSSAVVDLWTAVPTFSTVMTIPGINAPDESLTVPTIVPNVDWADDTTLPNIKMANNDTTEPVRNKKRLCMFPQVCKTNTSPFD